MLSNIVKIQACVRSGLCCKLDVCAFGKWSEEKSQCEYLGEDETGRHLCGKYDEINEKFPNAENPGFGSGCLIPFDNPRRDAIIKQMGHEVYITYGPNGKL